MRRYLIILLTFFCSINLFAQQDNYSFLKLVVFNDKGNVMLVKWDGEWEIPGIRYNQPVTLSKFIDTLASEHGIKVQNKKLNGLFTFEYENRPTLTIMHYYTAKYAEGQLTIPESCEDIGWFTIENALAKIPYQEMKLIISKITSNPNILWGAAIKKRADNTIQFTENFYDLK
ncbi:MULTISPECIES: NUDIX hydrolase [Sphingobacterium]|uniref:NUDIX hydrolase n=1 Tax=Sphingobacterium TaxID=28453 RepID=UPI00105219EB|nr:MULTISPECIES: NUDIX hydrolase [Sphingobacterium]MCW2259802.1 ADP-ribose pyrophosphatase YjhB (NUDIX family) [Sphingobacterium kitahiroshimense]TCR03358.1 hypothetical protein EDF67_11217 [Sphingobacterium sp. JUb78]